MCEDVHGEPGAATADVRAAAADGQQNQQQHQEPHGNVG